MDKKKTGKLATYATVLLLMVIIVIMIAAMADDREKSFKTKIYETTQTNLTIQDEIVSLKDKNYDLTKQLETKDEEIANYASISETNSKLSEIWKMIKDNKKSEASAKYAEIDANSIPEASVSYYEAIGQALK